ncbi:protein of unknown function [Nitrospira japonica]|uniref:Uncharacterized protein n=1 Tax=Nitrospira japonica TaxID=1325564 RepID=A0A1W1I2N5_9BACT|nr:protein of unknown function [Nitrospira japonica]
MRYFLNKSQTRVLRRAKADWIKKESTVDLCRQFFDTPTTFEPKIQRSPASLTGSHRP